MASTYTPIATTTLGSAATSYTFTSIPTTYTDLVLVFDGVLSSADYVWVRVGNGSVDTGSNYSQTYLMGNGSSASSGRSSSQTYFFPQDPLNTGGNNMVVNFQNYSNTTTYKSMLLRANTPVTDGGATGTTRAQVALWRSTSAINTIQISTYAGQNFNTGSTFTLYGIQAA